MKWAALVVALAVIAPLAGWLRRNPKEIPKIWILIGFLPFVIAPFHLYMAIISWQAWPGYVKGAEISVLDILAVALYFAIPRGAPAVPFRLSMALYFLAVVLSVFQSQVPMATLFYPWQLARMFLIYVVVTKACADKRVPPALLTGMTIGLSFQACLALWERFGLGILQTGGSLGHQNLLGLMSHFVVFPWFALLLAGERGWRPVITPIVGLVTEVLTVSRATVGLAGGGYAILLMLSAMRRWSTRKALVLAASVAIVCLVTPAIIASLDERFSGPASTNYDERAAFERSAQMMISDHPFGVGANYYVVIANTGGYNDRAGVAPVIGSESTNVHNIYSLVTAETGYIGLITFVMMLLRPLIVAFRCSWRNRSDSRGDLLLGLGVSLLLVYIHSCFEWIFITFSPQYLFALATGLVAGLATQLGYWQHSQASNHAKIFDAIRPVGNFMSK